MYVCASTASHKARCITQDQNVTLLHLISAQLRRTPIHALLRAPKNASTRLDSCSACHSSATGIVNRSPGKCEFFFLQHLFLFVSTEMLKNFYGNENCLGICRVLPRFRLGSTSNSMHRQATEYCCSVVDLRVTIFKFFFFWILVVVVMFLIHLL